MSRSLVRRFVGADFSPLTGAWLSVLAAAALSLVGIYAIDVGSADVPDNGLVTMSGVVMKQAIFLLVGLVGSIVVALPHYRFVRLFAWPLMAVVLALLVFLLIPFVPASIVTPRNGARAWINLGPVDFQPAELAKIAYVLVMADYLRFRENHRTILGLVPPALITFVPVALITLQPDLGTALLFAPVIFAMLIAAGARLKHLSIVVLVAILAAPAAFPLLKPHQKARIIGLIHMVQDPLAGADDINYQSMTAQRLAGAGGLHGVSDNQSRALVRFNKLPERHNDMIFAVIMNRFGFMGGVLVMVLYIVWFTGAYLTAAMCQDAFGRLLIVGVSAFILAQTFVNIAMTIGMLPIIGLTLPFVSYGGSSMLTVWVMTGMIVGVGLRRSKRFVRQSFEFDDTPYDPAQITTAHRAAPVAAGRGR
jgi:cell division protein FtsW (lipid II flippase)